MRPSHRQRSGDAGAALTHDGGRLELRVGGVVQSVDTASALTGDYWPAMLPDKRPRRALLLGAGGGTLIPLLRGRFGRVSVLAVDSDPAVIALGRASFYLAEPDVDVVLADAFAFAASCPARFDYVAVDLFRGFERPRATTGRPFLRDVARLAGPGGAIAFNLFVDRRTDAELSRIERVLTLSRQVRVGKNVVVHCAAR